MTIQLKALLLVSAVLMTGCSKTPSVLLKERYVNLGEIREVKEVFSDEHVVVLVGTRREEKCTLVETVVYNNINMKKEWHLLRSSNDRNCDSDKDNRVQEKYLKWLEIKNNLK